MSVYVYYATEHIGIVVMSLFMIYASIKYFRIKKNCDIYLSSWIYYFGMYMAFAPIIGIVSDIIKKYQYSSILGCPLWFILLSWSLGIFNLLIVSNYYLKVEEDRLIIHSIWFSKITLYKSQIDRKKSFIFISNNSIGAQQDEYFIFYCQGTYYKLDFDYTVYTTIKKQFIKYYAKQNFKTTTQKKDFIEFKKNNKYVPLNLLFINLKYKNKP